MSIPFPKVGTQKHAILDCLIRANGKFVPAFTLATTSQSIAVHSVIAHLRSSHGLEIINRTEQVKIGCQRVTHSFYQLPVGQIEVGSEESK